MGLERRLLFADVTRWRASSLVNEAAYPMYALRRTPAPLASTSSAFCTPSSAAARAPFHSRLLKAADGKRLSIPHKVPRYSSLGGRARGTTVLRPRLR